MWRQALLIGRRILPFVRSAAPITLALGVVVLLAATWWLGPRLEIGGEYPLAAWQMRALVTLVVVLLVAMVWGMMLARKLRKVNVAKAEEQKEEEDPILPLERRQQRLLDRRLTELKSNLPGRKGVYRLPWYLVMGLEDAGKTSLIQRSGQTYTLTNVTRNPRTERNPFGFEWWVGDNGVLIDPDGELLSQNQGEGATGEIQNRLWNHFIGWLERSRPQRPLNGVILAVDLARLSTASDKQREAHAILLRTRLRELMEQLGSRLPVYVTFTKMDLMYGFAPFVRTLSKAEKDKALGFTFRLDGQQDHDQWLEQFADRYNEMVDEISQRLPDVLADTRDNEERAAAYSFTRQLAGLKTTMEQFLTDLLSADAFSTPALVASAFAAASAALASCRPISAFWARCCNSACACVAAFWACVSGSGLFGSASGSACPVIWRIRFTSSSRCGTSMVSTTRSSTAMTTCGATGPIWDSSSMRLATCA